MKKLGKWNRRDKKTTDKILATSEEGYLPVVYRRTRLGRWHATGAQLQSCKKEIRMIALKNQGIGIDLRTSYPAIMAGLIEEISRKTATKFEMIQVRQMIRDAKKWRIETAEELETSIANVKRAVNALLFGMDLKNWRRKQGIKENIRSPKLENLEREIKEARTIIVREEIREGRSQREGKATTTLSRAVERTEAEIMKQLSDQLSREDWETTTLIHDEIIIDRSGRYQ